MKQITTIREMQNAADDVRQNGKRIGVVPTMGFLHQGHLSLIRIAKQHADVVITTIFVNPMQFAPHEDFASYPRDLPRDSMLAEQAGSDVLFVPTTEEVYAKPFRTYVAVESLTSVLEGASRPTHFRGVTTVVAKLFMITKPHIAVFGQKDAQQLAVIRQMTKDLNIDVEIVAGPIIREPDGLAMSSRNVYLSPDERTQSVVLSQSLRHAEKLIAEGERRSSVITGEMSKMILAQPVATIDYISVAEHSSLEEASTLRSGMTILISLAVRFGKTRLIDNCLVKIS